MTGCTVEDCARPAVSHGICAVCRVQLEDALALFPWLVQQLDLTITRQAVIGTGGGGEGLGFAREEADLLWVIRNTGNAWAILLSSRLPSSPGYVLGRAYSSGARWLLARLGDVLRMPELPALVGEFVALAAACERAIDRPGERVYVGPCDIDGRDLYAYPEAAFARCRCGAEYDVYLRRQALLAEAEDVLLSAVDVSRALTALGVEVTSDRVRQWCSRGKLLPHPGPWGGRAVYRVGDVRDLLAVSR